MDAPHFVQVYIAEASKELALASCEKDSEGAFALRFNGQYARISNRDLINTIAELCNTTIENVKIRSIGKREDDYFVFDLMRELDSDCEQPCEKGGD